MNELTRAELMDKICPTDAIYDCGQGKCSSSCDKCEDVLNYLLDRYDKTVRANARAEVIEWFIKNGDKYYFDSLKRLPIEESMELLINDMNN